MTASARGKNSLKLLGTTRGSGVLKGPDGSCEVAYHLDRYEGRMGQTASGEVEGELARCGPLADGDMATLVFANGSEIPVRRSQVQDDGADVEARGAVLDE